MKKSLILSLFLIFLLLIGYSQKWVPDLGNGFYKNPVIWADYSDPDAIRVDDDFYLTASSFNCVPALPILHSKDLVNWKILNYAVKNFPDEFYNKVQHGNGVWAPSIRYHKGWYYIYWGDPDRGIYMVRTQNPAGKWSEPILVKKACGNIDPCPLFDDDGKVYLVHAFANSRAGINNTLQVVELTPDGSKITRERKIVFTGYPNHNTVEGPKFYKRNGYYYIFTPAGGVATGYQLVLRSKSVWGPYEEKIVLAQGNTNINGPHQGAYIELDNGEGWFLHFQEKQPYGRIVHLQPVKWVDDWPVIGDDSDGDGTGQPVLIYKKPSVKVKSEIIIPQIGDEFDNENLSLAWQWQANCYEHWYSLTEEKGVLRLYSQYNPDPNSLFMVPNLLLQKFPSPSFVVNTRININDLKINEKAGIIVMGLDYATWTFRKKDENKYELLFTVCKDADRGNDEKILKTYDINKSDIYLQIKVDTTGYCKFLFSENGKNFIDDKNSFKAREGKWIGAKVGLFAVSNEETGIKGFARFEYFRIE